MCPQQQTGPLPEGSEINFQWRRKRCLDSLCVTLDEAEQIIDDTSAREAFISHQARALSSIDRPMRLSPVLPVWETIQGCPYFSSLVTTTAVVEFLARTASVLKRVQTHR